MIGALDPSQKSVTVVGAGIAGLLMADRLDRQGYEVTLLESGSRVGGVIQTRHTPHGMAESAVHSVLATPAVLALAEALGVELVPVNEESRARFVYRDGRPRKVPLRAWEILTTVARALFVRSPSGQDPHELTLQDWALRHLGRPALEYGLNPFLRGIYAARPSEISVGAAFPRLAVPERHSLLGGVLARKLGRLPAQGPAGLPANQARSARPRMMSARLGMGTLVEALEQRLRARLGERFRLGVALERAPEAANLVLCAPAQAQAALLAGSGPEAAQVAALVGRVRYAPLVSITVFARISDFASEPCGVGVLVPEREPDRECLGILFNSSSFPGRVNAPSEVASFTVMFGGTAAPHWVERSDEELRRAAGRELGAILGLRAEPLHCEISRWPRAVPVYSPELARLWSELRRHSWLRPGRVLFGNWTGQVSLRGMIETVWAL